ncbi:MAG: hypothetical protein WBC70_13245 [Candidatus Aminicenantales bacterium]
MNKRIAAAVLVIGLIAWTSLSCRQKTQVRGVELAVGFSEKTLTDNLITDVQYTWKTGSDFVPVTKDYTVYVHFWHGDNLLFQDDHVPQVPTSKWEPNQEYKYQRRVFIPSFIDEFDPAFKGEEQVRLIVGLYNPYDRTEDSNREVLATRLKVYPPPRDTPEIIYETGWHYQEIDPNAPLKKWRWTGAEARCIVDNPHRDALLVIRGGVNKDIFADQKVIVKINDLVLDEFIPDEIVFEKSYTVKNELLGDKDEFSLAIAVDKTFIPSQVFPQNKDERELGCQIAFIYFR